MSEWRYWVAFGLAFGGAVLYEGFRDIGGLWRFVGAALFGVVLAVAFGLVERNYERRRRA